MNMYRGDLKPDLVIEIKDGNEVVNLTQASSIRLIGMMVGVKVIDASVEGTDQGVITYQWKAGDTDTVGLLYIEIEIMWPGSKPQTVRPVNAIKIEPDYA